MQHYICMMAPCIIQSEKSPYNIAGDTGKRVNDATGEGSNSLLGHMDQSLSGADSTTKVETFAILHNRRMTWGKVVVM